MRLFPSRTLSESLARLRMLPFGDTRMATTVSRTGISKCEPALPIGWHSRSADTCELRLTLKVPTESEETIADRRLVEQAYAQVNEMWRTQGAAATLKYAHHLPYGRALPLGLDLAEIDRVIAGVTCFYQEGERDWPTQWFRA